jgi:SET domain-containing protein
MIYNKNFLNKIHSESYVSPKVERREISGRGYGLFAKEFISKNEIVSISGGVIVTKSQFQEMIEQGLDYAYHITDDFLICPLNPDDPSDDWRMNHCCEPNCGLDGNIIFIAIKDIQKDEELTYDYCMTETNPDYQMNLFCDKSTCRKVFTGNDWKIPEIQKKYKDHFSNYIKRRK